MFPGFQVPAAISALQSTQGDGIQREARLQGPASPRRASPRGVLVARASPTLSKWTTTFRTGEKYNLSWTTRRSLVCFLTRPAVVRWYFGEGARHHTRLTGLHREVEHLLHPHIPSRAVSTTPLLDTCRVCSMTVRSSGGGPGERT